MGRHKCEAVACLSSHVKCNFYELLYCVLCLWRINLIWFDLMSIVAKRSPISDPAEHLFFFCESNNLNNHIFVLIITRALEPVATCRQSPYLHKPAIIIMTSLSLWRHSHCYVIRYEAGHAQRYGRTLRSLRYVRTDTLPRLIYKDFVA